MIFEIILGNTHEAFLKSLNNYCGIVRCKPLNAKSTSGRIIAYFITVSVYNPSLYCVTQPDSCHRMSRGVQAFYAISC